MSHIYLKQNLNQQWRKHYRNGKDVSEFGKGNSWKSHSTIAFNSFDELEEQLLPYINGNAENASYCALMIGKTENIFSRNKTNVEDEALDYLLLDIETELPNYADINKDLPKIREWLIAQYEWINKETGMFLFFSNSSGIHCKDKHKQIRARAFVKIDTALKQEERLALLANFTKGKSKQSIEYNHLDASTLRRDTASIISPPLVENTKRDEMSSLTLVREGKAIETKTIATSYVPTQNKGKTTARVLSQQTSYWFGQIKSGMTYDTTWETVWSCVMRSEDRNLWEQKLVNKLKEIGSDRWKEVPSEFRTANRIVKGWFFLHGLKENTKHNLIRLDKKYISEDGLINWEKNGTIHLKSGIATGKTTALKKLISDNPTKSILYVGKNIGYVRNASETLGLDDYLDDEKFPKENEFGQPIYNRHLYKSERLSICYNSIDKLKNRRGNLHKFDIVIIDEARQFLGYSATASIIHNKESLATYMGEFVQHAELVVCLDADLDDLVVKAIEIHRGDDECFDIYWNTYQSLRGKKAYICRSPSEIIHLACLYAKTGKTFALVGDLTPKIKKKGKYPVPYIEEMLLENGLKEEEIFTLSSLDSQKGEQQDVLKNPNKYLAEKLRNGLKAFIATPSLTSGWDFSSDVSFDYVLGFYPSAILTATEIVQQLRRFRATDDFYLWIKPTNMHTGYELERLEDIWEDLYGYTMAEFSPLHELEADKEREMFDEREEIRLRDTSGIDWRFKEVMKASKASKCNLKLHFDLVWKENGGTTELSPYFDELWQAEEGREVIKRNKQELKGFYELAENSWERLQRYVKKAEPITRNEYKKILLKVKLSTQDKAKAIAYEIREEFDIPGNENIPDDVWERFNKLDALVDAYKNREIMQLELVQCIEADAYATSMPDKPNYVLRWLLLSEIKNALGIDDQFEITNKILWKKNIEKITKVIIENKKLLKELNFPISDGFEKHPLRKLNTIKKILEKSLDLHATYNRGRKNGTQSEQDKIIKYYVAHGIFQRAYGVGEIGWSRVLSSRQKRWKYCQEDILAKPFEKLTPQQQQYYLAMTPHIEVSKWKYEWRGKSSGRENVDTYISNFNRNLTPNAQKAIEQSFGELT